MAGAESGGAEFVVQLNLEIALSGLSLEDALRLVEGYVEHYNNVRLNSAVGYITPKDMLAGHQQEIHAERDRKLEAARGTAEESSPAGRVTDETDHFRIADHTPRNPENSTGGGYPVKRHANTA